MTITVAELLDRYERDSVPELAARTQIDYHRHIIRLKGWFGSRVVDELRPKDFAEFLNVKKGKVQRVRMLAVLSACFTQAVSTWFLIERNVLRDVKRPTFKARDRLIRDDEFAACKAMAPIRVRLAMELALLTGQRQGDIIGFKWSDIKTVVDKDGNEYDELHVQQTKTGKRMAIRVSGDLERALDACWKLPNHSEYVINKTAGGRFTSDSFRASWQRVQRKWMDAGNDGFHFHDIRALCATKCGSLELAQQLLGHSSPAMTRRVYRRGVEHVQPLQLSA